MSLENFGTVIVAHHVLRNMLGDALASRFSINTDHSARQRIFNVASLLFNESIADNRSLRVAGENFHRQFLDWVEGAGRFQSHMTRGGDSFIDKYITRPCANCTQDISDLFVLYSHTLHDMHRLDFIDVADIITSRRAFENRVDSFLTVSPLSLATTLAYGEANVDPLSALMSGSASGICADNDSVYFTTMWNPTSTSIEMKVPALFRHVHVNRGNVSLVNICDGRYISNSTIPTAAATLYSGDDPMRRYLIGHRIEHLIRLSSDLRIEFAQTASIIAAANAAATNPPPLTRIILRISGEFTLSRCGLSSMLSLSSYQVGRNLGMWNAELGSTILLSGSGGCMTNTYNILNRAYSQVYTKFMNQHVEDASDSYPLSGDVYEFSKLLTSLFGTNETVPTHPVSLEGRKDVGSGMLKVMIALIGLLMYGDETEVHRVVHAFDK